MAQESPRYRDPEWLEEQYVEKDRTVAEIASDVEVTWSTVNTWLHKYDIDGDQKRFDELDDEEYLREQYYEKEKSMNVIADEHGCSAQTVKNYMDKHDLERRSRGGANKNSVRKNLPAKADDPEWLREKYHEHGVAWIAEELGVNVQSVYSRLESRGIERTQGVADPRLRDAEWLEGQLEEKTADELSKELECTPYTIKSWEEKHGL